ncbi:hypothetical protein FQA39_LY09476 [Lamprigera yunnana]|nr:hypothetical protein FQA39_LY09476 [Lamprigera yunnana]
MMDGDLNPKPSGQKSSSLATGVLARLLKGINIMIHYQTKIMDRKKKPSGAFKHKQRQKSEDSKQKLPKIDKFFSQPSASTSGQNISIDSDSNNMATAVLVEKPTEKDLTIIAVGDTSAADHVNVDDVCMAHRKAEDLDEPQTSTFFEKVYDKSSYDL